MKNTRDALRIPLGLVLLLTIGCGQSNSTPFEELRITDDVDLNVLAHQPSKNLDEVIARVDEVLAKVYAEKFPKNLPNWIAFHASLMYGPTMHEGYLASPDADKNIARVYSIILESDTTKDGPYVLRGGKPYPRKSGPYFMTEHHPDQFLNCFSMGGGKLDTEITVDEHTFTLQDVFDRSLLEARPTNELALTVLAYSHYLQPGKRWENKFGEELSFAALLKELLNRKEATCAGAHRIGAFARTLSHEQLRDDPQIARLWPETERQLNAALIQLKQNQREDGGFALPGPLAGSQSLDHQDMYYTGHCVEWITLLGDTDYLHDDWVVRAVLRLADVINATHKETYRNMDMIRNEASHFDFDGLCHAMSGLKRWRTFAGGNNE